MTVSVRIAPSPTGFQCAPAAIISSFNYTGLLWATLFGFVFWDEIPPLAVFTGGGIVVAAGIYLARLEAMASVRAY